MVDRVDACSLQPATVRTFGFLAPAQLVGLVAILKRLVDVFRPTRRVVPTQYPVPQLVFTQGRWSLRQTRSRRTAWIEVDDVVTV
jgi:hypothetical protein